MLDLNSLNKSINIAERQRKQEQEEKEQVELSHNKSVQQIVDNLKKNGIPTQEQIENYIISSIRRIPDSFLQNLIEEYYSDGETDKNEAKFSIFIKNKSLIRRSIEINKEVDANHINSWNFNNTDKKRISIHIKKNKSPNYYKLNIKVTSKINYDFDISITNKIHKQIIQNEQEFKGVEYISYNKDEQNEIDEKNLQIVKDSLEILYKDLLNKSFRTQYLRTVIEDDNYDNYDWEDNKIYLNDTIAEAFIQRLEDFGLVVIHSPRYWDSQNEFYIVCKNPLVH